MRRVRDPGRAAGSTAEAPATDGGDGAASTHADEPAELSEIHDRGGLQDAEFERAKEKILH